MQHSLGQPPGLVRLNFPPTMKNTSRHLLGAVLLLGLTISAALAKRPNIVLILTDDQGWNNTEVPMIPLRADTRSDYYQSPLIILKMMGKND